MGRNSNLQLWAYWTPIGTKRVKCNYCYHICLKNATRCAKHTAMCFKTPTEIREQFLVKPKTPRASQNVEAGDILNYAEGDQDIILLGDLPSNEHLNGQHMCLEAAPPVPVFGPAEISSNPARVSGTLDGVVQRISKSTLKELQQLLVKAIVGGNVPFNFLENPQLKEFFVKLGVGFVLPSRREASGGLLTTISAEAKAQTELIWQKEDHLALIPDGWQNIRGIAVVNIMACNPSVCTYVRSFETGSTSQDTDNIKKELKNSIEELQKHGAGKVVAIVSDQGSGYKQARDQLQTETGEKILSISCSAHLLNLLTGDFCKLETVQNVVLTAKEIVREIRKSKLKIGEFNEEFQKWIAEEKTRGLIHRPVSLSLPCATRWFGVRSMFEKLLAAKPVLDRMSISLKTRLSMGTRQIIKDDSFWVKANLIYPIVRELTNGIKTVEATSACLSDVVVEFYKLQEIFTPNGSKYNMLTNILTEKEVLDASTIFTSRFADAHVTNYHYLANLLDPRYKGSPWITSDEGRLQRVLQLFESYSANVGVAITLKEKQELGEQLSWFRMSENLFQSSMLYHSSPHKYWKNYAAFPSTARLARIGMRLLSIPATSADVERSFSVQGNIHTKSRNRLDPSTIHKMMTVRCSLIQYNKQLEEERKNMNARDITGDEDEDYGSDDNEADIDEVFTINSLVEDESGPAANPANAAAFSGCDFEVI